MDDPGPVMTGAELRAFRESYGLSGADLANILRVDRRTIVRWEIGAADKPGAQIPGKIAAGIRAFERDWTLYLQAGIDALRAGVRELVVVTYRNDAQFWDHHPGKQPLPASWHRAMCYRIAQAVPGARILYADQQRV